MPISFPSNEYGRQDFADDIENYRICSINVQPETEMKGSLRVEMTWLPILQ